MRTHLIAEILKFTAEVTVKVNGIREAGESSRSLAENYGVLESTLRQRPATGTVPTGFMSVQRYDFKRGREIISRVLQRFRHQAMWSTIRMLKASAFEYAERNGSNRVLSTENKSTVNP